MKPTRISLQQSSQQQLPQLSRLPRLSSRCPLLLLQARLLAVAVAGLAALITACGGPPADMLARQGIAVSSGAAAGYVADEVCGRCHADLFESFQDVGMARSFSRPRADRMIEDFASEPFYHQPSERYYRMRRDGEQLWFERWQVDQNGQPIHRVEIKVDWVLGSGHTSRTYLFQTADGELYQLPLAWYSQPAAWGMAPGFDRPRHLGLQRRVHRECMFCHNAYPEVPTGSDAYSEPHIFPAELPQGIGCQRCHGPGAQHVQAALVGDGEALRKDIINPSRLSPELAADICYGCHFQPSVTLMGLPRFGRNQYSFRPGEKLTDFALPFDVEEQHQPREQRFEINHHPYRLEQSACFQASPAGSLSCTQCHDPHRKVPVAERPQHYRQVCQSCHAIDACTLDAMNDSAALQAAGLGDVAEDDCSSCHMPRRRTQDVVQVVMTDHRIQRLPSDTRRLAPRQEIQPVLVGAELMHRVDGVSSAMEEIYKASAVLRAGGNWDAVEFLTSALESQPGMPVEPQLDLLRGLLGSGRFAAAEDLATEILEARPELARARQWRALARIRLDRPDDALADLDQALSDSGAHAELLFNRGLVLLRLESYDDASQSLRQAVELRPNLPRAWTYLGRVLVRMAHRDEAEQALRQALRYDPTSATATIHLGRLLASSDRREEAVRILEHGVLRSQQPEQVLSVLLQVEQEAASPAAAHPGR